MNERLSPKDSEKSETTNEGVAIRDMALPNHWSFAVQSDRCAVITCFRV